MRVKRSHIILLPQYDEEIVIGLTNRDATNSNSFEGLV
jgi:hypothetical protein